MTSKEALETVKDYLLQKLKGDNSELGSIIIVESVNVLEKIVERDTPIKVKNKQHGSCPVCNQDFSFIHIKYCFGCGQRLDWRK